MGVSHDRDTQGPQINRGWAVGTHPGHRLFFTPLDNFPPSLEIVKKNKNISVGTIAGPNGSPSSTEIFEV